MGIFNWRRSNDADAAKPAETPDVEAVRVTVPVLERQAEEETLNPPPYEGESPRRLAQRGWAYRGIVALDVVLVLIPVLFIGQ